jgi:hypothetical protein
MEKMAVVKILMDERMEEDDGKLFSKILIFK